MAADSQCGPSNALQNLQKLTSADRTLQQDRLSSRNSPLQGFRSLPGPSSIKAEAEFEAFQNNADSSSHNHLFIPETATQDTLNLYQSPQSSSWVSDFRKLNFTQGHVEHNEFTEDCTHALNTHGKDFLQVFEQPYMSSKNETFSSTYSGIKETRDTRTVYPTINNIDGILAHHHQHQTWLLPHQPHSGEIFDEEGFSRAFDLAAETEKNIIQETVQDKIENNQAIRLSETLSEQSSPLEDNVHLIQVPIGADTIENEDVSGKDDQDSLSKTASKLLSSVHNDQSKKFQNSQFIELMRRFRDKEATIKGDQVVGKKLEIL